MRKVGDGCMTEGEEAGDHASHGHEPEDIALETVNEAIQAVANDDTPTMTNTPPQQPANLIPEIEDVDDPEEMVEVLLTVGEERSRRNDVKGALAAFNKAISIDPSCDMAWFNRGVLLEAQQDARGARQSFQICLDLNDQHAPATANMAILLERIGDLEGAYDMAQRALGFFPGHPALVELMARCKDSGLSFTIQSMEPVKTDHQEVDMNSVEDVARDAGISNPQELLQEAVHHDHDGDGRLSEEEWQSAADVVVAQQEVVKEIEALQPEPVAQEVIPDPPQSIDLDALVEEAIDLIKAGDPKQALALLKPHLKTIGARHAGAWRIAGGAMARLNQDTFAIAAITHAQNLEPEHASGWFNLGSIQQRNNMVNEALSSYQSALSSDPTYTKAAEKMVMLSQSEGRLEVYIEAGRQLFEQVNDHEERPRYISTLLQLAQGESDVLDNVGGLPPSLPAGPEMARLALTLLGDESTPQRALALSLSLQHSDAVMAWKSLIQQESENPSHWTGLARALEQAGDLATAEKCHAKAASMNGQSSWSSEVVSHEASPTLTEDHSPTESESSNPPEMNMESLDSEYSSFPTGGSVIEYEPTSSLETTVELGEGLDETVANQQPEPAGNELLLTPETSPPPGQTSVASPEVDLAKAALDIAQQSTSNMPQSTASSAVSNQDVAWFNQGVKLIEENKYREALSCFDKALQAFAGDDSMIIRILNNRGNAFYFLEEYPKCVESYHQAMLIRPTEVKGETLYNMGTAYAEMERYNDAIKCFEQAMPRGLSDDAKRRAKDQIRRCNILQKALDKKRKKKA